MRDEHAVPHSSGTRKPAVAAPEGACDAHIHVYDRRFPLHGSPDAMLDNATADDYRLLQQRIGTQRTVVVQPRVHGTDNSVTLAAIQALGAERTRGVAVVRPEVSDAELERLHAGGIRGIRFTLYTPANAATDFAMVEPLAHRVHAFGWHVQLHWSAAQIVEHSALLARLPCTIVLDHLARMPLPDAQAHPAFDVVSRLLDSGSTWIKLSGAYLDSQVGAQGGYADTTGIAQAWVRQAPERMVWGSDWPHPTEREARPDDAQLFDLLGQWVPDEAERHRVLVDNPARLYDFS
ncbi:MULTISPECIES: amidohydrolase family protein [unclassified Variovorax]|jgi:predicted TIM-barrel fold metal-dependent hydrolase|uniref:amidohydrolase family protein n=1 Tax=unclassified Variovorax TaxID=663243 RepID=UPI000F7D5BA6|nr:MULTISPECIES: amidohydrolase family protein [unclassified Variovorax]RSZ39703.1 2-pyrone-4,6-dicarboxylate hydrolase [Variovorax sp. 553]RSZ40591.1 2-pyrone-4,6-dicarboxylate hydrolase [Variovorax sp. 679]